MGNSTNSSAISVEKYNPHFEKDTEDLLNILDNSFSDDAHWFSIRNDYIESLTDPTCNTHFIISDKVRVGTFEMKRDKSIASLGILPKYQKLGIGTKLLTLLLESQPHIIIYDATVEGMRLYQKFVHSKCDDALILYGPLE